MARKSPPPFVVTHDDDGGLTINDRNHSGLVVSIVRSNPLANGPKMLLIEVYPYMSDKRTIAQDMQMRVENSPSKGWVLATGERDG